jgi:hypothetical protein
MHINYVVVHVCIKFHVCISNNSSVITTKSKENVFTATTMLFKESTLRDLYFSQVYFHTSFNDSKVGDNSAVASTSQVRSSAMFLLMVV